MKLFRTSHEPAPKGQTPELPSTPPRPVSANLSRLQENLERERAKLNAQQAQLDQKAAEARLLQDELRTLNKEVDDANDRLALAEVQCATFVAQLAGLKESMLGGWGNPGLPGGPNYRLISSLECAIADFPRVRSHLASQVRDVERLLSVFEEEHGLR